MIKKYQSEIAFIESQLKSDDNVPDNEVVNEKIGSVTKSYKKLTSEQRQNLITEREKRLALIENEMLYSQSSSTSSDFA
jgi:hypothetical protein